jgi:PPK2 family polyphosphate:nucleotide phosphotransferase
VATEKGAFRVEPTVHPDLAHLDLAHLATEVKPLYTSHKDYKKQLKKHVRNLSELQRLHYASDHWSLLLIFQGMDAAGKDGAIRHVMSGVNPQGCQVFSFKQPTDTELKHDFLWRTTRCLPERGRIGIFNRSYYEDVLVARVHPEILHGHGLPDELIDDTTIWDQRYRSIRDLEKHLHGNGTQIVKIFLHLSKDEQAKRFRARIDDPDKNWKFSLADIHERSFWDTYMKVYAECISATSSQNAPWYVVPADDKHNARLMISQIVLDTLEGLNMAYPETSAERHQELEGFRSQL